MNVFKYTSKYGPAILRERRIKVSTADSLNDPFEFSPRIDSSIIATKLKKRLRQKHLIDKAYRQERAGLGIKNKRLFKAHYLNNLKERTEKVRARLSQNVEELRKTFAQFFSQRFRLFCASKVSDSILMWSHYGSEHKGMVIEFDTDYPVFNQLEGSIFEVSYSKDKPDFIFDPDNQRGFEKALENVVLTKAKEWEYEAEIRMMFPASACSNDGFVSFHPSAIRSVLFGCRCNPDYKSEVLGILSHSDFSHVGVYEYQLSKEHYALEKATVRNPRIDRATPPSSSLN